MWQAPESLLSIARDAAHVHDVPFPLLAGIIHRESSWNPDAYRREPDGRESYGLAQVLTETARQYGIIQPGESGAVMADPGRSIHGCAIILRDLLDRTKGDWSRAASAYNAGIGGVHRAVRAAKAAGCKGDPSAFRNFGPRLPSSAPEYWPHVVAFAYVYQTGRVPAQDPPDSVALWLDREGAITTQSDWPEVLGALAMLLGFYLVPIAMRLLG